jgi:hypothetical protein
MREFTASSLEIMKKIILIIFTLVLGINVSAQINNSDLGAAGIEYLLSNPITAGKLNTQETLAIGLIGKLLGIKGQRQHELNTANTQRTTINVGSGATLSTDAQGNVYLTQNGMTKKISQSIIDRAHSIDEEKIIGTTLRVYDVGNIERKFNAKNERETRQIVYTEKKKKFADMISNLNYSGPAKVEIVKTDKKGYSIVTNTYEYENIKDMYVVKVNYNAKGGTSIWGSTRMWQLSDFKIRMGSTLFYQYYKIKIK